MIVWWFIVAFMWGATFGLAFAIKALQRLVAATELLAANIVDDVRCSGDEDDA